MDEPIMTKYEYTRIRGIRIQQLIDGMQPFVDYEKDYNRPGFTYTLKKFVKAAGKRRYLGTFNNRIDYIFRSPWIPRKKILGLCIDESGDLAKRKPSDHYPLVMTYSSVYPNDRNDKVDDSNRREGQNDDFEEPERDM